MRIPLFLGVFTTLGLCQGSPLTETTQVRIPKEDPQKQTEADNIQAAWADIYRVPSEDALKRAAELKRAAQLAQEGYLSSVKNIQIVNVDISEIPSDQLAKLVSIVTDEVYIDNNNTPSTRLGAILASVQSKKLGLQNMSLSKENTRALVTAMRDRVLDVRLYANVILDPELLSAYDGQGRCTKLVLWAETTKTRYGARMKRWAGDRGWRVTQDELCCYLVMKR